MRRISINRRIVLAFILSALVGWTGGCGPQVFDVTDFGAVGDSISDDSDAIQRALSYCSDSAGGGVIYFPPGVYRTTYSLMYGSNTRIVGRDGATVFCAGLRTGCTAFLPVSFDTTRPWVENVVFENLTVNGLSPEAGDTVRINGIGACRARNVRISNCRTTKIGYHFADVAGCENVVVENCHVFFSGSSGIQIDNITGGTCIKREPPDHSIVQIAVQDDTVHSRHVTVVDNLLDSCIAAGVHLHRTGGRGAVVANNVFRGCGRGVSIDSDWGSQITIENNTFFYGKTSLYRAIEANGGIIDQLTVKGNRISRCLEGIVVGTVTPLEEGHIVIVDNSIDSIWHYYGTAHGIRINGNAHGEISHNRISNVGYFQLGKGPPDSLDWVDSVWEAETARVGILLSNCHNMQVTSNELVNIYGVGIAVADTCDNIDILGNRLINFASGIVLQREAKNIKMGLNIFQASENWTWSGIWSVEAERGNRVWQNRFFGNFIGERSAGLDEIIGAADTVR